MKNLTIAVVLLSWCGQLNAVLIFSPGDDIWGVHVDGDAINVGVDGFAGGTNIWAPAEAPENAINGVGQKYLNSAKPTPGSSLPHGNRTLP